MCRSLVKQKTESISTWSEVFNKDLNELGILCKENMLDRMRLKQLICKCSTGQPFGSCLLKNLCLVPAHPGVPG